ncbi:MAG: methyl-accepting chemotaxis protein, partial [Ignavibacteria bacterium]
AAMVQLNQITQQNASASEELAATAEEMSGQATNLQQLMAFFSIGEGADRTATSSARQPGGTPRAVKPPAAAAAGPLLRKGGGVTAEAGFTQF